MEAVRQIRAWEVIEDMRPEAIEAMIGIKTTLPIVRPDGWAEYPEHIHAVVNSKGGGQGSLLCTWGQKTGSEVGKQTGKLIEAKHLIDYELDTPKDLCSKCMPKLPASCLVEAMEAGILKDPA